MKTLRSIREDDTRDRIIRWLNIPKSHNEVKNFKKISIKNIVETDLIQTISLN